MRFIVTFLALIGWLNTYAEDVKATTFRLMTWNAQEIGDPGSDGYLAEIDTLERVCAEIVCVQEIGPELDLVNFESLAQDAGYLDYYYGSTSGTLSGGMRNGALSALEIVSSHSWSAAEISGDSNANDITRDIVQIRILLEGNQHLGVIVLHLKAIDGATNRFRRQIEIMRACLVADAYRSAYPDDFLIVCGDINQDIDEGPFGSETWHSLPGGLPGTFSLGDDITFPVTYDPFEALFNIGLSDCYATWEDTTDNVVTYPGYYDSRLDYIFYDPSELQLIEDEVYNSTQDNGFDDLPLGNWMAKCASPPGTSTSTTASDHLPVLASFAFSTGQPTATPEPPTSTPSTTPTPHSTPSPTSTTSTVPIFDIQFTTNPSGASPMEGQAVTTTGIITSDLSADGLTCIQEGSGAWSGLTIYLPGESLFRGQEIVVSGTVQEYYGMTELTDITSLDVIAEGVTLPGCQILQTGDVAYEQWEGVLIEVVGVSVTNPDLGYGEWEVDDGSGALVVDDLHDYSFVPVAGFPLYYLRGQALFTYGSFKLEPRNDHDIGVSPVQPTNTPILPTHTPPPTDTPTPTATASPTETAQATVTPTEQPTCVNHGDVNLDGNHTASDAQLTFFYVIGLQIPTYQEACHADCNGNGSLSAADAQLIFMAALGGDECVDPLGNGRFFRQLLSQ